MTNYLKLFRNPSIIKIVLRDTFKLERISASIHEHLAAAIKWLCGAQDITGTDGVSAGYSLIGGWLLPYPETTGYIIPTFLKYWSLNKNPEFMDRAVRMGDWEIEVQHSSGAVRGGVGIKENPIVFNTGQVILGWTCLYGVNKISRFIEAAIRAADWLVKVQDEDGKWSKFTYMHVPHVFHSRVAWSLFKVYEYVGDNRYKIAAEKQIKWIMTQKNENAYFNAMGFAPYEKPLSHTIGYTLRGLLESSSYVENNLRNEILYTVEKAAHKLMVNYEIRKKNPYLMPLYFPATWDERWKPHDTYSCLTGNAQLAIIWLKLFQLNNDARYLNSALKMIDQLRATQSLTSSDPGIRGGIAGSYPIWGKYQSYSYPNWAAKFFCDAIMLQESIIKDLEKADE